MAELNKITYKTVIAKAIGDFNAIQNALNSKSGEICDATSGTLVETDAFAGLINQHLVYPSGTLTITKDNYNNGTISVAADPGVDRSGYKTIQLTNASGWSLGDISESTLTVGTTKSNNAYTITGSFKVTATPTTKGWVQDSTGVIESTNKVVGTIKAAEVKKGSDGMSITGGWLTETVTFTAAAGEMTITPSSTLKIVKDNTTDITQNILSTSNSGLTNYYTITIDPAATISGFKAGYFHEAPTPASGTDVVYYLKSAAGLNVSAISGSAGVSVGTSATNGKYQVTATNLAVSANHTTAGYAKDDTTFEGTKAAASVVGTIDAGTITTSSAITAGTTFKPTIAAVDISDSNGINAAKGDIFDSIASSGVTTTKPTEGYYLAIQTSNTDSQELTATGSASVSKAGYVHSTDSITSNNSAKTTVSMSKSDITYVPITSGSCTVLGGDLSIKNSASASMTPAINMSIVEDANAIPAVNATISTDAPLAGAYYVKLNSHSAADSRTIVRSDITDTHTAGYIANKVATTAIESAESTITMSAADTVEYLTLTKAVLATSVASNKSFENYTEVSNLSLSGGYLYINSGYIADTRIKLGDLIPDFEDNDATGAFILKNYKAYDEEGNVLTGGIETYAINNNFYTTSAANGVAGSKIGDNTQTIKGMYVPQEQYIKKGSATISLTSLTNNDTYTPEISKVDVTGSNGATAASGDIYDSIGTLTTTVPTTGYYLAVKSNAQNSKTIGITSTGLTEGWITSADINSSASVTVNLADSATTYLPINAASVTSSLVGLTAPTVAITTSANKVVTATSSDYYIELTNSETNGGVKSKFDVSEAGYVYKGQTSTVTTATAIDPAVTINGDAVAHSGKSRVYIQPGSITSKTVTATITANSVAATATQKNAIVVDSASDNLVKDGYVTVAATAAASFTVGEGYHTGHNDGMSTTTSDVNYIPASIDTSSKTNGTPSVTISLTGETEFNESTGVATKAYASNVTQKIDAVTAVTDAYDNKYIVGYVAATSNEGTATVTVGENTTGTMVDHYTEQLYKRMLGLSYIAVKDDEGVQH